MDNNLEELLANESLHTDGTEQPPSPEMVGLDSGTGILLLLGAAAASGAITYYSYRQRRANSSDKRRN